MRQWGHAKDFCPPGLSFGSLQGLSCCAQWRRNNAFTSTSCPGKCHIALSVSFPVLQPFQVWRTVRRVKNHFTWGKNTHSNWLSRWEWGSTPWPDTPFPPVEHASPPDYSKWQMLSCYGRQQDYLVETGITLRDCWKIVRANKETGMCQQSTKPIYTVYIQVLRWWLDDLSSWDSDTVSISLNSLSRPSFRGTSVKRFKRV